jgi:hypothetical protein
MTFSIASWPRLRPQTNIADNRATEARKDLQSTTLVPFFLARGSGYVLKFIGFKREIACPAIRLHQGDILWLRVKQVAARLS